MKNLLLITGCVNVKSKEIKLKNSDERLEQYKETIRWAIEDSQFDIIIFCENSNCKYDFNEYVNRINKTKKTFEYLSFQGSNKTIEYGIAYGEMEIIEYAYNNSKYFKYNEFFWKLTGRIKIDNVNKILQRSDMRNFIFLNYYKWFDTRFYKMPVNVYEKYFKNLDVIEIIKKDRRKNLEAIYHDVVDHNKICKKNNRNKNFPVYPIFVGVSGSTGVNYSINKIKFQINNLLCKFSLFNNQIIQHTYILLQKKTNSCKKHRRESI